MNVVLDETYSERQWLYDQKTNYKFLGLLKEMHMYIPWIVITNTVCKDVNNPLYLACSINHVQNKKLYFKYLY